MKFVNANARIHIPDGAALPAALSRTTDLCVCAHQDDAEIMAFCAISACYENADRWYTGVTMSDGVGSPRAGRYADYTDEQMMAARAAEQERAADLGKYAAQFQLGYPSAVLRDMRETAPVEELISIVRSTRPARVYLHNPADKHDTHLAVFVRALEALRSLPADERPDHVYGMEVWRALDWLMPEDKVLFDCSGNIGLAERLLRAFDSQVAGGKQYDRAAVGRWYANATFLESHETDGSPAISYGIDLTPLLDGGDPADFILRAYMRTAEHIRTRLCALQSR